MSGSGALKSRSAGELVRWAEASLGTVSATARLEAELLIAEFAGTDRVRVMAHPELALTDSAIAEVAAGVGRRRRGEPLAYILGRKEFYGLSLAVTPEVLVPRPETELLVEAALDLLPRSGAAVVDLGTGSGAIALALVHERPGLSVTGVDSSAPALAVARRNARMLGLDVEWLQSDWFAGFGGRRFDLVVSNPPYVASGDPHFASALAHEPRSALDGGDDGLDACRAILDGAEACLEPGGQVLFEHGFDQRDRLVALARAAGFEPSLALDDLAGLPRVAGFTRIGHG